MKRINLEEARKLLKAAMETMGPEFVYASVLDEDGNPCDVCVNIPHPATVYPGASVTGCIVGTAMLLSGRLTEEQMREEFAFGDVRIFTPYITRHASMYFTVAQVSQDSGSTWGEAVRKAEDDVVYIRHSHSPDEEEGA